MVRYFAEFTIEGKRITTYVADGMPYTAEEIMLDHPQAIEISAEEQSLYLQGYIRGINGKPQKVVTDEEMLDEAKKRKIEEVIEDARIYGQNFEKNYCDGYSDFQFPFTVSFFEIKRLAIPLTLADE